MITPRPKFADSPYLISEMGNWHLEAGAPKEVVREFNKFMKDDLSPTFEVIASELEGIDDDIIEPNNLWGLLSHESYYNVKELNERD